MSRLVVEITNNATPTTGDLVLAADEVRILPFTGNVYAELASGTRRINGLTLHTVSAGGFLAANEFTIGATGASALARVKVGTLTTQGYVSAHLDSAT